MDKMMGKGANYPQGLCIFLAQKILTNNVAFAIILKRSTQGFKNNESKENLKNLKKVLDK